MSSRTLQFAILNVLNVYYRHCCNALYKYCFSYSVNSRYKCVYVRTCGHDVYATPGQRVVVVGAGVQCCDFGQRCDKNGRRSPRKFGSEFNFANRPPPRRRLLPSLYHFEYKLHSTILYTRPWHIRLVYLGPGCLGHTLRLIYA